MTSSSRRLSNANGENVLGGSPPARRLSTTSDHDHNGKGKGKAKAEDGVGAGGEEEEIVKKSEDQEGEEEEIYDSDEDESLHCAICLSVIDNRTVVQPCMHGTRISSFGTWYAWSYLAYLSG